MDNKQAAPASILIFWQANQVSLTFHSPLDPSAGSQSIIQSLNLDTLNQFLNEHDLNLTPFGRNDISRPRPSKSKEPGEGPVEGLIQEVIEGIGEGIEAIGRGIKALGEEIEELGERVERRGGEGDNNGDDGDDDGDLKTPRGKYLFPSPTGTGTTVIAFFHVNSTAGNESDTTPSIVKLINRSLGELNQRGVPIQAAAPNWIGGATAKPVRHIGHGGPGGPPLPIVGLSCDSYPSRVPIAVPQLSETVQSLTGQGVTVFVLDTMPLKQDISDALARSGDANGLLKDMVGQVGSSSFTGEPPSITVNDQFLSTNLDDPTVDEPETGQDLSGELVGFPMPDHGLFIAGIVRDLASSATIECIRVLNNFGVLDGSTLTDALQAIQGRMTDINDLQNRPVVINLSLYLTPTDAELVNLDLGADLPGQIELLRQGLHDAIQSLIITGAVFVVAAGNDSTAENHLGPRYPAAFAGEFPQLLSVGAVNSKQVGAQYSNQPGPNGIATYGGDLPTAVPPGTIPPPLIAPPPTTCMTGATNIDAVVGVYSSTTLPRLIGTDCNESYPTPDNNAWAYWYGTSFAAPIISAVVARILSGPSPSNQLLVAITNAVAPNVLTQDSVLNAPVLQAVQCGQTQTPPLQ